MKAKLCSFSIHWPIINAAVLRSIITLLVLSSQVLSTSVPRPDPISVVRIDNLSTNCPYTAAALSPDPRSQNASILTITYDTSNSSAGLVALGLRVPPTNNTRTCRLALETKFDANGYTVNVRSVDFTGAVTLDHDVEARIETSAVWDGNSGLDPFTPITLSGPIQNSLNATTTNVTSFTSFCAPYQKGATLTLVTKFSLEADEEAAWTAAGVLGIGGRLVQRVVLGWESCRASECVDRNGVSYCR